MGKIGVTAFTDYFVLAHYITVKNKMSTPGVSNIEIYRNCGYVVLYHFCLPLIISVLEQLLPSNISGREKLKNCG
jgi:hypothetical protein